MINLKNEEVKSKSENREGAWIEVKKPRSRRSTAKKDKLSEAKSQLNEFQQISSHGTDLEEQYVKQLTLVLPKPKENALEYAPQKVNDKITASASNSKIQHENKNYNKKEFAQRISDALIEYEHQIHSKWKMGAKEVDPNEPLYDDVDYTSDEYSSDEENFTVEIDQLTSQDNTKIQMISREEYEKREAKMKEKSETFDQREEVVRDIPKYEQALLEGKIPRPLDLEEDGEVKSKKESIPKNRNIKIKSLRQKFFFDVNFCMASMLKKKSKEEKPEIPDQLLDFFKIKKIDF